MTILPIDEINALEDKLRPHFNDEGKIKSKQDADDILDEMLDIYLLSYTNGVTATNNELGTDAMPPVDAVNAAVYAEIAGKTWQDRVIGYYESGGSLYDIMRIAETDATRIYNQGAVDAVVANGLEGSTSKRWRTMQDDRVRDTHDYLEGMVVPFNERFYTYDGDSAEYPGGFALPQNNVNCRCVVEVIRG